AQDRPAHAESEQSARIDCVAGPARPRRRGDRMKRRAFITLLGGAMAWPLAARAQQPDRVRRIGVLANIAENDPESRSRSAAFQQTLQQLGWTDGRNVQIDYRWALGDVERTRKFAAELVALARRLPPDGSPRCRWRAAAHPQWDRLVGSLSADSEAASALQVRSFLLDGEAVACDG